MQKIRFAMLAGLLFAAGPTMSAPEAKLPPTLTLTAYDTGTSGFNIVVAVGKALKDKHGTDTRVLPAGNDVARLAPVKAGRAQVSAMGIGTYFAQEGVLEFGVREWGPQPLRVMISSSDCNGLSLGVAKDTGVKQIKDLKGKRIGIVVGSPALNQGALAVLAYAGLTKDDVRLVEFSSYGAMWKGVLNNEADAAFASTISGQAKEVEASPRGLFFPAAPSSDKAGWTRILRLAPYYYPHQVTCGAGGLSPKMPSEIPAYPYPIFMTYDNQPSDLIYAITKAMIADYEFYKDGAPGASGLEVSRQNLNWVVPYHDGAIRAYREAGLWTKKHDAHNQALLKRQDVLAAAWKAFVANSPPEDKDAFRKAWTSVRSVALSKAGLDVVFD